MSSEPPDKREPTSAPGDFYVENQCCISCGVPQMVAPDLIGWANDDRGVCYWKKQPETPDEMRQAFAIFDGQEAGCHRYAGHNPEIQRRVGFENCDHAPAFLRSDLGAAPGELQLLAPEEPSLLRKLLTVFRRSR